MSDTQVLSRKTLSSDLMAGVVVCLVATPLCVGIAAVSNAPPFSGLISGVVGGLLVGLVSKSHTSVSGPAVGLTALIAGMVGQLHSFEAFLLAVVIAGLLQMLLGVVRMGSIAGFFPYSVIRGLLAAIGVILVLKQIPHVLGHDTDPEGEMSFSQPDHENTLSEIAAIVGDLQVGSAIIGITSVAILMAWKYSQKLKAIKIPAPLIVIAFGIVLNLIFRATGSSLAIGETHLVNVPVAKDFLGFWSFWNHPNFSQLSNPAIYTAAVTIAVVASMESLLNTVAMDKLDRHQRTSPLNDELIAQGVGNVVVGLIGGLPITSVVVPSAVHVESGGQTKLVAITHGILLLTVVALVPGWLNLIPISCLAAILLVVGLELTKPVLIRQMWSEGRYQFLPFVATVIAIVLTDLFVGVLAGLGFSVAFILLANLKRPINHVVEKHLGDEVQHIELANQVSFLNRPALMSALDTVPRGGHVLLDAQQTVYIDPDILSVIREYKDRTAPVRNIKVSLRGFRERYHLPDEIHYHDWSTRDVQGQLTSRQVLDILIEGNLRFQTGRRLNRDLSRQLHGTADGQHPLAVVLSCIDSRSPAEMIFDLGLGDIFNARVAGNVISPKVLGSMEYGCAVAGAKLLVVMGHTRCGAVSAAIKLSGCTTSIEEATGCQHLAPIVHDIQLSIDPDQPAPEHDAPTSQKDDFVNAVARCNVLLAVSAIQQQSRTIRELIEQGRVALVGAMYDITTGQIEFFTDQAIGLTAPVEVRSEETRRGVEHSKAVAH